MVSARSLAPALAFAALSLRAATVFPDAAVPVATSGPLAPECKADADCAWRDPCAPKVCVPKKAAVPYIGCDKSFGARGTCGCIDHRCAYTPRNYPETTSRESTCRSDGECGFDAANGICLVGRGTTPSDWRGPRCTCSIDSGHCVYGWPQAIPCKSWRDCSWVREPRVFAVPSSVIPRPHDKPVRPCRDGEVDSVCGEDHTCRIVAWTC